MDADCRITPVITAELNLFLGMKGCWLFLNSVLAGVWGPQTGLHPEMRWDLSVVESVSAHRHSSFLSNTHLTFLFSSFGELKPFGVS